MTSDDDSEPRTPPQTPSALHKLGLVICPACRDSLAPAFCDLCGGGRRVAVDVGIRWRLEHGDTEPPSKTEP